MSTIVRCTRVFGVTRAAVHAMALLLAACQMAHIPAPDADTRQPVQPVQPVLSVADASARERDGVLRFTVSLSAAGSGPVIASYATEDGTAKAGSDYQSTSGSLTFPAGSTQVRSIVVRLEDDKVAEGRETFIVRLSAVQGAVVAADAATAVAVIVDDDQRALMVEPDALNVPEGGSASYTVALGSEPTGPVTVTVSAGSVELEVRPQELTFAVDDWHAAWTVTVIAAQDEDAAADVSAQITHTAAGGGYDDAGATVTATVVEDDVSTLAVEAARATEGAGALRFAVTLSVAIDRAVSVHYATGADADTATEGQDYSGSTDTLRFPAGTTAAQTVEVAVLDDSLDEPDERLTVTLSRATVPLAGGQDSMAATGIIEDDDEPPRLSIADAELAEGEGAMSFEVQLLPASALTVTVQYGTVDQTATAGTDYTGVSGTLTFAAGATARTIAVPIADDQEIESAETFTVVLSAPESADLDRSAATGEIPRQRPAAGARTELAGGDRRQRDVPHLRWRSAALCRSLHERRDPDRKGGVAAQQRPTDPAARQFR